MRLRLFSVAAMTIGTLACGSSSPTSPGVDVPFTKTDLRVGTGDQATGGKQVTVNYTGWLYDSSKVDQKGTQFDTTTGRGSYQFVLGAGRVIPGWDQGLVGMQVGGLRRLVIPPSLGYGQVANGPIPANSTLVFEVELLAVQ
jgi:FKBP-type peptidyl-prolyl cis-trans isomerase